jgi:hypothetical protein
MVFFGAFAVLNGISPLTLMAVMREAARLAMEKAKNRIAPLRPVRPGFPTPAGLKGSFKNSRHANKSREVTTFGIT